MGRITTVIERSRAKETDSISRVEDDINTCKQVVADPGNMVVTSGDTYKATYQFSISPIDYIKKLKMPVTGGNFQLMLTHRIVQQEITVTDIARDTFIYKCAAW